MSLNTVGDKPIEQNLRPETKIFHDNHRKTHNMYEHKIFDISFIQYGSGRNQIFLYEILADPTNSLPPQN